MCFSLLFALFFQRCSFFQVFSAAELHPVVRVATTLGNARPPFGPVFIAVSRPSLIAGTSSARVNFSKFRRNFQRPSGHPLPSLSVVDRFFGAM